MASRIMHIAVASELTKILNIKNRNQFLLGALAPDLINHGTEEYKESHFGQVCESTCRQGINWECFINKYDNAIRNDEFLQGYLVHLITDACWIKLIQDKFVRTYPNSERDQITIIGYSDMKKVNRRIIDQFNLEDEIKLPKELESIQLDEINLNLLDTLLGDLKTDFMIEEHNDYELQVYTNDAIDDFLVEAIKKSISEISLIKNGLSCSDPKEYFVC